jgi:hypothetical protein
VTTVIFEGPPEPTPLIHPVITPTSAPDYRFIVYDTLSGQPNSEIPLTNVKYTLGLNGAGSLSGTVTMAACDPALIGTMVNEIGVWRNGQPMFVGPVIELTPNWVNQEIEVRCASPWFYLTRRSIELAAGYANVDVADAVWDQVYIAQNKAPNGDLRIEKSPSYPISTGQETNDVVSNVDTRMVAQVIDDWARQYPGFDYTIEYAIDPSGGYRILRYLGLYAPFKGVEQPYVLTLENGLIDFSYTENGADVITRVSEMAQLGGSTLVVRRNSAEIEERDNVPMLEEVNTQNTDSLVTLGLFADGDLYLKRWPLRTFTAKFRPNTALPFGFCSPGDTVPIDAKIDIYDAEGAYKWTWRVVTKKRVVGITVELNNADETVQLDLNEMVAPS